MKKMTIVTSLTGLMTLSACMGGSDSVTRSQYVGDAVCPGRSEVSTVHMQSVNGLAVRCGPQTQNPITYAN